MQTRIARRAARRSVGSRRNRLLGLVAVGAVGAAASLCHAAWPSEYSYTIDRLGYYDVEHTFPNGGRVTNLWNVTTNGYVAGESQRTLGGSSAWVYNPFTRATTRIGLTGDGYMSDDGRMLSGGWVDSQGRAVGHSDTFIPGQIIGSGRAAFAYDPIAGTSTRIGLYDEGQLTPNGGYYNTVSLHNGSRTAAGHTERYTSWDARNGYDAWVFDHETHTTTQVGFFTGQFVSPIGYRETFPQHQSDSGSVYGYSAKISQNSSAGARIAWRFVPETQQIVPMGIVAEGPSDISGYTTTSIEIALPSGMFAGESIMPNARMRTWIFDESTGQTTTVGLYDPENTGPNGGRGNVAFTHLTSTKKAAGTANRYGADGSVDYQTGRDAWVYDGTTTHRIGLMTPEHALFSDPTHINDAGYVAGTTVRANNGGDDVWVWNGTSTVRVSLTDAEFVNEQGRIISNAVALTQAGHAYGYTDGNNIRRGVWGYNATTHSSRRLGFIDGPYINTVGSRTSNVLATNDAGICVGNSWRFNGTEASGNDIWRYDPLTDTQVRINPVTPIHLDANGDSAAQVEYLNEAGVVVGAALRRNDALHASGIDVWYFDPVTMTTHEPLVGVLNATRWSDGYTDAEVTHLTESGIMLGFYRAYLNGITDIGDYAFMYRPDFGFTDLGALVDGGLTDAGWIALQSVQFEVSEILIGRGSYIGQSSSNPAAYFAMQRIPTPGTAMAMMLGLGLARGRRRR